MVFIFLTNYFLIYELATITFTDISLFDFNDVLTFADFLNVPDACLARAFIPLQYEFNFTVMVILHHNAIESTHSFSFHRPHRHPPPLTTNLYYFQDFKNYCSLRFSYLHQALLFSLTLLLRIHFQNKQSYLCTLL